MSRDLETPYVDWDLVERMRNGDDLDSEEAGMLGAMIDRLADAVTAKRQPIDEREPIDQTAQLNAAYAALDAVCEWAQKEDANSETGSGTRLLALLLKHGVHPRAATGDES
jgi:hypothetical protein